MVPKFIKLNGIYTFTFYSKIQLRKKSYIAYFIFESSSNDALKSLTPNIASSLGGGVWFGQISVGLVLQN
jgi:hypothetical protein